MQTDETLRQRLLAALTACLAAWGRIRQLTQLSRRTAQLVADPILRRELGEAVRQLEEAQKRIQPARSHRLRNTLFIVAVVGAIAAPLKSARIRSWFLELIGGQANTDFGTRSQTVFPTLTGEPSGPVPEPTTPERGL